MRNGSIHGNIAYGGGGVSVISGGTFFMQGNNATLSSNVAKITGGGIYVGAPVTAFLRIAGGTVFGEDDVLNSNKLPSGGYGKALRVEGNPGNRITFGPVDGPQSDIPLSFQSPAYYQNATIKIVSGALMLP